MSEPLTKERRAQIVAALHSPPYSSAELWLSESEKQEQSDLLDGYEDTVKDLERQLAERETELREARADAASWEEQCESARDALIRNGRDSDAAFGALAEACKWAEIQFQTLADEPVDSQLRLDDDADLLSGGVTHKLRSALALVEARARPSVHAQFKTAFADDEPLIYPGDRPCESCKGIAIFGFDPANEGHAPLDDTVCDACNGSGVERLESHAEDG